MCHKYCSKTRLAHSICPFTWGWNAKHNVISTRHNSNNLLQHLLKFMFTFENNILRSSALTSLPLLQSMYVFLPIAWRITSKIFRKLLNWFNTKGNNLFINVKIQWISMLFPTKWVYVEYHHFIVKMHVKSSKSDVDVKNLNSLHYKE